MKLSDGVNPFKTLYMKKQFIRVRGMRYYSSNLLPYFMSLHKILVTRRRIITMIEELYVFLGICIGILFCMMFSIVHQDITIHHASLSDIIGSSICIILITSLNIALVWILCR